VLLRERRGGERVGSCIDEQGARTTDGLEELLDHLGVLFVGLVGAELL
jgi:hypothetical protein